MPRGRGALLLVMVVRIALRNWRRVARVLAPMALTTVAIVAVLRAFGVPLDLFHLMSLVLAAGLGVDYALFFERTGADREERLRTLHAVLVCSVSTLMVFALLSFSSIPVLRSIGVTVALGVVMNFMLALAMPRATARPRDRLDGFSRLDPARGVDVPARRGSSPGMRRSATVATEVTWRRPIRCAWNRLHAINLCEYGAQAMAVHGGLVARTAGRRAGARAAGFAARGGAVVATHVESLAGRNCGRSRAPGGRGAGGLQYRFRVSHAGSMLARGPRRDH